MFRYDFSSKVHKQLSEKTEKYKIFDPVIVPDFQVGSTCKINAIAAVLNYHHQAKNLSSFPLRTYKDSQHRIYPQANLSKISLRQIAKEAAGSKVGEIYNAKMIRDLIDGIGTKLNDAALINGSVSIKRFNLETDRNGKEYIQYLIDTVDKGVTPPIVFFDVDRSSSLPRVDGDGSNEHAAVVVGYCYFKNQPNIKIILSHWGGYHFANAEDLIRSSANLEKIRSPEMFYKIEGTSNAIGWQTLESLLLRQDNVRGQQIQCQIKYNQDGDPIEWLEGNNKFQVSKRQGIKSKEEGFNQVICTIEPLSKNCEKRLDPIILTGPMLSGKTFR